MRIDLLISSAARMEEQQVKLVKSRFRTKKGGGFCATNSSLWSSLPVGVVGTTEVGKGGISSSK